MTVLLSDKQRQAIAESTAAINIWTGAIRSGKTLSSLLRWLIYVAAAPTSGELVMIGRTRDSIARNAIAPLQDPALFGKAARYVHYTRGASTAKILDRTVEVIGANDAKAEPKVRGLTCAGAYVDELTTLPEAFWTMLMGRMSVAGSKIFATTNPDSPAHWLKAKFLDRLHQLQHWRHWHFVMDDNPSLSDAYKAQQRANYTGLWFRRFILGEWVAAEGAIYSMWDPARHVVPHALLPVMRRLLAVGVDYGTTNATAALMLGLAEDRRLYLVDEWRHDPKQTQQRLTDAQLSAHLRGWLDRPHVTMRPGLEQPRVEWVAVDPSAASFKVQLHNDGVTGLVDADNDVAYGIRTVASGLAGGWLKVSDRCAGFIAEAPGYAWDPKATEKGEDKPIKVADHSLDGGRYALTTTEALWRAHITTELEEAAA